MNTFIKKKINTCIYSFFFCPSIVASMFANDNVIIHFSNGITIHISLKINLFIYLFLAAWHLCCCMRAFSSCGEQGLLFVVVCRLLIAEASLVAEHGL